MYALLGAIYVLHTYFIRINRKLPACVQVERLSRPKDSSVVTPWEVAQNVSHGHLRNSYRTKGKQNLRWQIDSLLSTPLQSVTIPNYDLDEQATMQSYHFLLGGCLSGSQPLFKFASAHQDEDKFSPGEVSQVVADWGIQCDTKATRLGGVNN